MLFLFRHPKYLTTQTNAEARQYWVSRETQIRIYFSIITTVLIVIGIEISAPNQHLSQLFVTYLADTTQTGHWLFTHDWVSTFFPLHRDELTESLIYSGGTAKAIAISLIFFFFFIYAISNDPLSNTQLLKNLTATNYGAQRPKVPFYSRIMPELGFYARHMPSTAVDAMCRTCGMYAGCGNSIGKRVTDSALTLWTTVYFQLSAGAVHDLLFRSNRCRAAFLLRYSFWCAAIVLLFVHPSARIFEFLRGVELQPNYGLLIYIGGLIVTSYVLGWAMYGNEDSSRGFWGHFKDGVDHLIASQEFAQLFERHVCQRPLRIFQCDSPAEATGRVPGSQIQRLLTLIHFLDMLVERKAIAIVEGSDSKRARHPHLTNILFSLTEMFHQMGNKRHVFRSVLLSNSPNLDYLDPVVFTTSRNGTYLTLTNPDLIHQNLSKKNNSIAMQAISSRATVSAVDGGIPRFHDTQLTYQKSIIAYPIVFGPKLRNALLDKAGEFPIPAAVLVIDTTDELCFSPENQQVNEVLIRPFANRIMFEMAVMSSRLEGNKE